ncbi:hypothetical protein COEREDRAFT_89083 [Coemansia reversa NRRL 1564]|uniref:Uncharacterized protein n=1 Tax=Coemansia reversa (strain ATCC 12441 / NRRL 1564) TaxID=763665 RepID=A0A2G5B4S9_COERN|nr:hypothetical protein COEREDRAFT_89083 [Coemansia reversa NRRL 1564]|eukprot:PIA14009.1 hypothetical protein COEREDRAFT_89083 [Coemansia reversa NRRL 1564]
MRQKADQGRHTNNSSISHSNRRNRQPARRLSGRLAPDLHMIASSDSDDIECVTPFSQTRRLSRHQSMPAATVPAPTRVATGTAASNTQPQRATQPAHHVILDTDEDDEFVEASPVRKTKRSSGSSDMPSRAVEDLTGSIKNARATATAPKRARVRQSQRRFSSDLMSSPSLLRASSPTIQRFNSNNSGVVVLVGNTQDPCLASGSLPPTECLTGSTVVGPGLSAVNDVIPPSSPPADCIPETPRHSPGQESASSMVAVSKKTASADLSSDPISDFGSQTDSASCSKNSRHIYNAQYQEQNQTCNAESGLGCIGDNSSATEGGSMELTSVTQWYHNNLLQGDQDELERIDEHSSGADSTGLVSDGGYSSPLEGFWDLRNDAHGSTLDRELYMNQFEPTARQHANRKRKEARQMAETATATHSPNGGTAGLPLPPTTGRGGRGRGGNARGGLRRHARTGAPGRRRGGAIRPAHSTRVAGPPRAQAAAAYNYYADDPFLDVAGSMGWEGGGTRRFG